MGKIVVIEGTDFSGKSTQYEKIQERLAAEGVIVGTDSFPNYDSESSYFVKEYLGGKFGTNVEDINPKVASTFYTLDRYASYKQKKWGEIYRAGGNVLFARYMTSNILHQACKYSTWKEKKDYIDWLYSFEVEMFGIPKEDEVILLDMPPAIGQELKKQRLIEQHGLTSSGAVLDIHEANAKYMEQAYRTAKEVADYLDWNVVSCVNSEGKLRSIESIHNEIYNIVKAAYKF